jgi:hypothetical protein
MDPRTGLGRFRQFRISNYEYGVGGHEAAGTCQTDNERAETNKSELIARLAA